MTARVLVVDDDRAMVRTLCDILRLRGWECDGAYSGEEAVTAVCGGTTYSSVLMDIKMPGMDGVEAFKTMKGCSPEVRVMLMTAHTSDDTRAEAEREGAYRVLTKPVDFGDLLALLK